MYDVAHRKYKEYKFTLSGHSQGGLPTNILLNTKKNLEGISLNPAYKGEYQGQNEYIIRSSLDPVSIQKYQETQ
jgi:retron-type reverse transcriptase